MTDTIKGYLRYEPDMRFTANGVALTKFTLYDTSQYEGDFSRKFYVVTWESLAEECNAKLVENDFVYAKGYWKERSWQNKEGKTIWRKELTATDVWLQQTDGSLEDITKVGMED